MSQQQIDIATIEGLLAALKDPNLMVRTATLRAIARYPEKAASLARADEVDLFRKLAELRDQPSETRIRVCYVEALLSLADDRVPDMAKEEFLATNNPDIALLTASRLAGLPAEERITFFYPVVMASTDRTKSRAAANLLAHCRNLPTALALRVAVVSDHKPEAPPVNDDTLSAWLEELQGPYPRTTRRLLLARQDDSLATLLAHWEKLPDPIRLWAFQEAVRETPGRYESLIKQVIKQGEEGDGLLHAALEALSHLCPNAVDEEMLAPYYLHKDPAVRAAAIGAGQSILDWTKVLENESPDMVRTAIVSRVGRCARPEDASLLASLLEDPNWRIRAAATNSLIALAPASLSLLQELLIHPNPVVKAAAIQALYKLGKADWALSSF